MATRTLPRSYFQLVNEFPLVPIRSEKQLDAATEILHRLVDKGGRRDSGEEDYMDVLSGLIAAYEDEQDPIEDVPPDEMLAFLMEQHSLTQQDLARKTGIAQSTLSALLRGTRRMTVEHMRTLAEAFGVKPATFLTDR